jgi:hypothetical protein
MGHYTRAAAAAVVRPALDAPAPGVPMDPHSASLPAESRALHPQTEAELRAVIADRWRAVSETEEALSMAVGRVAREARANGMRPEELLIALKSIEAQVLGAHGTLRGDDMEARRRFREWLVSNCVRAYFAEEAPPSSDGHR